MYEVDWGCGLVGFGGSWGMLRLEVRRGGRKRERGERVWGRSTIWLTLERIGWCGG